MKKRYPRKKSGLPLLPNDDYGFGGQDGHGEGSFAEVFDEGLFDRDSEALRQRKPEIFLPRPEPPPPPQETLDLHGLRAAQAEIRVENFILTARGKGLRTLRVVTGKGLHSEGQAVLPHTVEVKVMDLQKKGLVQRYFWEKGVKEKSGALIVYL